MLSVAQARELILSQINPLGTERVDLLSGLHRVLAEDIISLRNLPPWDNSAMDGFAVRAQDTGGASPAKSIELKVIGDLPAGHTPAKAVEPGEAVRIMTGAPLPPGADAVVMVEYTQSTPQTVKIFREAQKSENLRRKGEDVKAGDLVLPAGKEIRPADIGMLAALGRTLLSVYLRPRVAVLATGDELVEPDQEPGPGQIITSNNYALAAQVLEAGALAVNLGIARDTTEDLGQKLKQAAQADLIITSGGVSVGDYDLVKQVLADLGTKMDFWKVAMKPGKPLAFGTIEGKPVFGLPGYPVSTMVSFELFARPAILKMMGHHNLFRPVVEATLEDDIKKEADRTHFVRVVVNRREGRFWARSTGIQKSGVLRSMVLANGLAIFSAEKVNPQKGEKAKVMLFTGDLYPEPGF
jgi:molybdopterin molybdotransferase